MAVYNIKSDGIAVNLCRTEADYMIFGCLSLLADVITPRVANHVPDTGSSALGSEPDRAEHESFRKAADVRGAGMTNSPLVLAEETAFICCNT